MDEASAQAPLKYEETPIIEPIVEKPVAPPQPKRQSFIKKFFGFIGNLFFFMFLFIVGVFLGAILRQFVPTGIEQEPATDRTTIIAPTPTMTINPTASWVSYQAASGISYKLPPDVLAPICDGVNCASQGTYLPGGTRFTVSHRGTSLSYIQKAIITDSAGRPFTTREATVSGSPAIEYTGSFRGTTTGGYTFSQMRGYMIGVSNAQTLEMNHFAPAGVTVDFASDDALFDKILDTIKLPTASSIPSATSSPSL